MAANETLRIQVVIDHRKDALLFSLLDMQEEGRTGPGRASQRERRMHLADSAVSSLTVRVNDYAALKAMIKNSYNSGWLVDVLRIEMD